jgi:nitrogen fixation protein
VHRPLPVPANLVEPMSEITVEDRCAMTRRTMSLLEGWGLGATEIMRILKLPDAVKARNIARFRDEAPFPDDPTVLRRMAYLLRIEEALQTYFPRNPEMRDLWVKRGNKQFGRRAPVAVMVEDGESGLISVLSHLDCTFAWDLTGSESEYSAAG